MGILLWLIIGGLVFFCLRKKIRECFNGLEGPNQQRVPPPAHSPVVLHAMPPPQVVYYVPAQTYPTAPHNPQPQYYGTQQSSYQPQYVPPQPT